MVVFNMRDFQYLLLRMQHSCVSCEVLPGMVTMILCLIGGFLLIFLILRWLILKYSKEMKNVTVIVLGDLGRSPRMQYHASSFAAEGFRVKLIGYPASQPFKEITDNPSIHIHYLRPVPNLQNALPSGLLHYVLKVLWQSITLLGALFVTGASKYILIQNPPAVPTIPICWLYCTLSASHLVIDWHNYAHSLMALNMRKNHPLIVFAKHIETIFGAKAYAHLCVTKAMKEDLKMKWNIEAQVLYDRPASKFSSISLLEKHNFLLKLSERYTVFRGNDKNSTIFTEIRDGEVVLLTKRSGLLVSSTSWTEDEDFSILINALQEYENICCDESTLLPNLICVITGKGPLKEFYTSIIKLRKWSHITVITPWLENEEYPKILACADLGVSLHTSSSGLDLPMKIVDMFGCNLPVCAYSFSCLSELVRHNENGYVFSTEKELTEQLKSWFFEFPNNEKQQLIDKKFRQEISKFQETRWHDNWVLNTLPYFTK